MINGKQIVKGVKEKLEGAKETLSNAKYVMGTKGKQNAIIKKGVDLTVEKNMRNMPKMERSMNNMIGMKKTMDKNIKTKLKGKGIYS